MIECLVQVNSKIYDISGLVTDIEYTDSLNDGCSKLEFEYIDTDLVITNGSVVRFKYNDTNIFYGKVFKTGRAKDKARTVTAYDQLRYCKSKDTIVVNKDTTSTLVKKMSSYFGLTVGTIEDTKYVLATSVQDDKTWLDIVYDSIADTLVGKSKKYRLADEFGSITLRDIESLKLNLILGDESLCYDFDHELSIDDNFYNQIKLVSDNESTGKRDVYITKDFASIKKYGLLQYFETMDKNYNSTQAKKRADALLSLYNHETESLDLDCIGDVRIRAGVSFYGLIDDINLNRRLLVNKVTHKFLPTHTMNLEVAT